MAQAALGGPSQEGLFDFEEFLHIRSRYSNLLTADAFPANDRDQNGIANVVERIDRTSAIGILVRTVASHPQAQFTKHVGSVCDTVLDPSRSGEFYTHWLEVAAEGQNGKCEAARVLLKMLKPPAIKDLLIKAVLLYPDVGQAVLASAKKMTASLSATLDEVEAQYQSCFRLIQETQRLSECRCELAERIDEFLENCCETSRLISLRREQLHLTIRMIDRAVEQNPAWESRRHGSKTLDKLYWECDSKNIFQKHGTSGTDDIREHLVDILGGITEKMTELEREQYREEGLSFRVLEKEQSLYQVLKHRREEAEKLRSSLSMKDMENAGQTSKARTDSMNFGDKHISEDSRVRKAETRRLKRRRAKDRKALAKALDSLSLSDMN